MAQDDPGGAVPDDALARETIQNSVSMCYFRMVSRCCFAGLLTTTSDGCVASVGWPGNVPLTLPSGGCLPDTPREVVLKPRSAPSTPNQTTVNIFAVLQRVLSFVVLQLSRIPYNSAFHRAASTQKPTFLHC